MMKERVLLFLVTASVLLICCNCVACKKHAKSNTTHSEENTHSIQVDDSVKRLLGDSVAQIIFEADTIRLYSLSVKAPNNSNQTNLPQKDSISAPSFHACYIAHDYGMLSKTELSPILHILSDRDNYFPDGIRVLSPFTPNVALSFKKGSATIDIIFSFAGGQMYIIMANENELYFKYTYERLVMKFFQNYLQDERIAEYLNL